VEENNEMQYLDTDWAWLGLARLGNTEKRPATMKRFLELVPS
jgi:hypothetical protein